MLDQTLILPDGRSVGFSDYGSPSAVPVIWCHGGPGSRLQGAAAGAQPALRVIGIDRPGYGLSTPQPDRNIGDWPADALAVADHLGIERFLVVGISTGGAYALALAAAAPERVMGVVTGCAMTDMRHAPARESMAGPATLGLWNAPDREAALAAAIEVFGADGTKVMTSFGRLPKADIDAMMRPEAVAAADANRAANFAWSVQGYTDDRLADGVGWGSFDIGAVTCPVIIVHGESDTIVPVLAAHHTASLVPGAQLRLYPDLGHLSIAEPVLAALMEIAAGY
jgi:pimeloyl-ACP methyl ester carboxylesterase